MAVRFPSVLVIIMTVLTRKGTNQIWFQKEPWQCGGKQAKDQTQQRRKEAFVREFQGHRRFFSFPKGPTFIHWILNFYRYLRELQEGAQQLCWFIINWPTFILLQWNTKQLRNKSSKKFLLDPIMEKKLALSCLLWQVNSVLPFKSVTLIIT